MIFKVKTPEGIVVVKVNVANPDVLVDGNRITVTWADGGKRAEIHVPPGSRKIELKKDGFTAFGETVSIADGGQELLAATLEPLPKPAIKRPSPGVSPGIFHHRHAATRYRSVRRQASPRVPGSLGQASGRAGRADQLDRHEARADSARRLF